MSFYLAYSGLVFELTDLGILTSVFVKTGSVQLLFNVFIVLFVEGDKTCQEMSEQFVPCQAAVFVW